MIDGWTIFLLCVVGAEIGFGIGMVLFTYLGERKGKHDRDEEIIKTLLTKGKITVESQATRNYTVTLTQIPEAKEEK